MRACTIGWLVLLAGCAGGAAGDPDDGCGCGCFDEVDEESETPLFGGQAEETEEEILDSLDVAAERRAWRNRAIKEKSTRAAAQADCLSIGGHA